jgi:acyl dehydratase
MGMMGAGMLANLATDTFGPSNLRRISLRMTGIVWPGDSLRLTATVDRYDDEVGVALSAWRRRDLVVRGHATFARPHDVEVVQLARDMRRRSSPGPK